MKKASIIIIIGFSISLLISCFSTEHYLIKGIKFYGVELSNPDENYYDEVNDTMSNQLFFQILGESEYQYGYLNNSFSINSCYATSVPKELDNYILIDSLQLRFDSDIYFENDTIKANTDLWNHPKLKGYKKCFNKSDESVFHIQYIIGFIDSFYDKIRIPNKDYKIELTCKTNDGLTFVKQISLYLKIDN